MGLGEHGNWVREEFLANVEVKSGNLSKTPKSQHHKITSQLQSNLIIHISNTTHHSSTKQIKLKATQQIQTHKTFT